MTPRQRDLLSAAARHINDAEYLLSRTSDQSQDQAWHLAGFCPECLRKACLEDHMLDLVLGHDFGDNAEKFLSWGLALDPHAWRYNLSEWSKQDAILSSWNPVHRYEKTGTRSGQKVEGLVRFARTLFNRVSADLWADGLISGKDI